MPCNTVRLSTINLANVDQTLLTQAFEAMGLKVTHLPDGVIHIMDKYGQGGNLKDGKLVHNARMVTTTGPLSENRVKQAYSGEVIKSQAKKFGWNVRQTADNQYVMVRR